MRCLLFQQDNLTLRRPAERAVSKGRPQRELVILGTSGPAGGLVAGVEGDQVRLSANSDVALTFEEEE